MGVSLTFTCDGCFATAEGVRDLRREFRSVSGRSYGIGAAVYSNSVDDLAPDGWVAYDPDTYCTYCPSCWAAIKRESAGGE